MKLIHLMLAAAAFCGLSCERHEFEGPDGTKQLHQHGKGHDGHDAHHGVSDPHDAK